MKSISLLNTIQDSRFEGYGGVASAYTPNSGQTPPTDNNSKLDY
jgi:hypothetical protein